ncbi:HlyD family efflux transporter periplasmic adaptor subunit [uncultured Sanguibacteroides sp.]|uniref:HlyD family secretion protein n=1 Tax=uncultured Sanguibacteroides sp. TaxID=1635151 RepID=UPI0025CBF925|nr:HlyD family efflux transporter periplasmic adaptor subunit [uncultured Sanguibacteroides sp.]
MKFSNTLLVIALASLSACKSEKEFDATGTFEATEIIVSSEANGKLFYLNAEEGSKLTQGTEVGLVDTVQLYLKKLQLQASMKSVDSQRPDIRKQIAATQEQIATAKRERTRVENLLKANAANQKQLDDWDSQLAVLHRQLDAQISSLQNSTVSLNEQSSSVAIQIAQIEDQLQKCRILAPIDGTVLAKYAEPGELASTGKPLFKIADMENIYLRAYITSAQLSSVNLGNKVKVFADFGHDNKKEYEGSVTWIADEAEFTPKTILTDDERANQVYAVKIAVRNDGTIKIGMYGEIKF